MKTVIPRFLAIAAAAFLASCANPVIRHTPIETAEEMSSHLETGMPASKVTAMLGHPDKVEVEAKKATWSYRWPEKRLEVVLDEEPGSNWVVRSWTWQ